MTTEIMLTPFGMIGSVEKHFIKARQRRGIKPPSSRASTRAVVPRSARTLCAIFGSRASVLPRSPSASRSGGHRSTGRWRRSQPSNKGRSGG